VAAVLAASTCEAMGEDAALQVGSEVPFHPEGDAVAKGVGLDGLGEECLKVVLDHRVEWRRRGPALPVDGTGRCPVRYLGPRVPVRVSWEPLGQHGHGRVCYGLPGAAMAHQAP